MMNLTDILSVVLAFIILGLIWFVRAAQRHYSKNTRVIDRFMMRAQSCTYSELRVLMWEIMEYQSSQFLGHEQTSRVILLMSFIHWLLWDGK